MNINEDKFANKSAEEIIDDMLIQHRNNSKEALEHIQDILKDDGLTLGNEAKANLEKAATILSDKGLKEGWFSKPKSKYAVKFEVYLPFKKEPAQFQIPPVESLNDPLVKETLAKIRKRHPKSTIYIRSELGDQKITEGEDSKKMKGGFIKSLLSNDITKNLAATALAGVTGISPAFTQKVTDRMLNATANKFENVNQDYQVNLYTENNKYTCHVGSLGIALALAEKASSYNKVDVLKENTVICSYDKSLKEWSINKNNNELKEDIYSNDDIEDHSYVDFRNDITNIDERAKLIQCHLNPDLIDKRKPKWHNIFGPKEYVDIPDLDKEKSEVLVTLDGIDQDVNIQDPAQTEVILMKKLPFSVTDNGKPVYKDGNKFVVTVAQFIKLLNDPENAEALAKFEKSKDSAVLSDDQVEEFATLDRFAKEILDSKYPEWEKAHEDIYNLDNYTLPERAEIYKAWKDINRTNMYQQARELTPEEVNKQFGFRKLKKQLRNQKDSAKLMAAYDSVRRALPENDQVALDDKLLDILNNTDESINPIEIRQIIGYYGAKNQLNQLSKGKLAKIANDLPEGIKSTFDTQLEELLKTKYVDTATGLPKVVKNPVEAFKDVNVLLTNFTKSTNSSIWNQKVNTVKEVGTYITDILNTIKEIEQVNPDTAKNIRNELIGAKNNWRNQQLLGNELINKLAEFLQYADKVKVNELEKDANIKDINMEYLNSGKADIRNEKLNRIKNSGIVKSDQEIAHNAWLKMVKSIVNPKSKSVEDPSYYTAITNKISRLVKTDPQTAHGYHKEFTKLLNTLEAENATEDEVKVKLANFLATIKDETKGYGTVSKALNGIIVNNGEL